VLVQQSAFDEFMALLEPAVRGIRVGDPLDSSTEMGPLISAGQRARVASYVPDDAPVAFRGTAPSGPGFWFPPTVLGLAGRDSTAFREEIFGPVLSVVPFRDEEEAVRIANDTHYGRSGPGTSAVRCASPAPSSPATSRSTPTPRSATPPHSAASSSPASAAS
jgi:acyl-CoA reductase-like NAD-dependent aldehyde dehydrogenase